jgi:hypothetical protein
MARHTVTHQLQPPATWRVLTFSRLVVATIS